MTAARTASLLLLLGCASPAHSTEQQVVTIKGTVFAAIPCVINNNKPIGAPFGDVQTAGIDGYYKTITLTYSLDCSRSASNELRMLVRGDDAGFDATVLGVPGHENLGIALKKDGNWLAINTWTDFDTNKQPLLQAVLVKRENSQIKAGAFSASATLVVDYR
jgi:type 1 fimbria pilin